MRLCFSNVTMDHEVACVDLTPLIEGQTRAELCVVGQWTDISARILKLPDLSSMHVEMLGGGMLLLGFCMHIL